MVLDILKLHIFYQAQCRQGLQPLWRVVSKQCGFSDQIHWFCVDGEPIHVKKYAVSKIYGF